MSTPQPPRRRRIAGESKPGAPAPKSPVKKPSKLRLPKAKTETPAAPPQKPPKAPRPPKAPKATPAPAPPPVRETAPAAVAPAVATDVEESGTRLPRPSARLALLVLITVAAVAFGVFFGIRGYHDWRNDNGTVDAQAKAASTAATSAETIFTYQYNQLDQHLRRSKATMTPAFAKKFDEIAPALQDLAPQRKIRVKATVRNAAAVECGDSCSSDKATVLVFIDQARVADGDDKPTVFGNRIELMMVEQDGRWRVNNIKAL